MPELEFTTVHPELTDQLLEDYSRAKFGSVAVLAQFSTELTQHITSHYADSRAQLAVFTATKYPAHPLCRKSSLLVTQLSAEQLGLPIYVGEFAYNYATDGHYDDYEQRHARVHKPYLADKEKVRELNLDFLLIDDARNSGNTLRVLGDEARQAGTVRGGVVLVDLSGAAEPESIINNLALTKGGLAFLARTMLHPDYVFTTQMVREVTKLDDDSRHDLLGFIGAKLAGDYEAARKLYYDEVVPQP